MKNFQTEREWLFMVKMSKYEKMVGTVVDGVLVSDYRKTQKESLKTGRSYYKYEVELENIVWISTTMFNRKTYGRKLDKARQFSTDTKDSKPKPKPSQEPVKDKPKETKSKTKTKQEQKLAEDKISTEFGYFTKEEYEKIRKAGRKQTDRVLKDNFKLYKRAVKKYCYIPDMEIIEAIENGYFSKEKALKEIQNLVVKAREEVRESFNKEVEFLKNATLLDIIKNIPGGILALFAGMDIKSLYLETVNDDFIKYKNNSISYFNERYYETHDDMYRDGWLRLAVEIEIWNKEFKKLFKEILEEEYKDIWNNPKRNSRKELKDEYGIEFIKSNPFDEEFKDLKDIKEIKSLYRKLSKQYHPDLGGNEKDFIQLKEAYDRAMAMVA